MEKTLVVSGNERSASALSDLMKKAAVLPTPFTCTSASRARRMVLDESWDLVVINTPLQEESGIELSLMISEQTDIPVILFTKEENYEDTRISLEGSGVIILTKPVILPMFNQALQLASCFKERIDRLKAENRKLEGKLEELKVISKAKCVLIAKKGCSEEEAHHLLERRAMNMRLTRLEAANAVIRLYSN